MFTCLFGLFSSCTRSPVRNLDKPLLPGEDVESLGAERVLGCIFCDVSKEKGFDIVWEDDTFIVFNDYRPAAAEHLLVIPKRHVASVKTLKRQDASLVSEMAAIGNRMLDTLEVPSTSRRLGFHIPPFNSVQHLHLHVQAMPYKSVFHRAKYPIAHGGVGHAKGFSWFVEVCQAIRILEDGGLVGVFPC